MLLESNAVGVFINNLSYVYNLICYEKKCLAQKLTDFIVLIYERKFGQNFVYFIDILKKF